jgi:hypothetical protein
VQTHPAIRSVSQVRLGDPVGLAGNVRGRTRPRPGRRACHHLRFDGVPLDVPHGRHQVPAIHRKRRESPLPQMPPPALAEIDHPRVATVGLADGPAQGVSCRRDNDQMNMIRHEAVRPDADLVLAAPLDKQVKVRAVVILAEERRLPPIAPLRDMMWTIRNHNSC